MYLATMERRATVRWTTGNAMRNIAILSKTFRRTKRSVRPFYFIITSDGRLWNHDYCGNIQVTTPLLRMGQEKTNEEQIKKEPTMPTYSRIYQVHDTTKT